MAEVKRAPRMRVWIVAWAVSTAVVMPFIVGSTGMPWASAVCLVALPLVLGALALLTERRRVTRTRGGYEIETQAARSEATLMVSAEPSAVRQAVRHLATGRFRLVDERAEELTLRRRMNLATWGMTVRVGVRTTGTTTGEGTRIHVSEEPRLGTTIYDWGQGRRDIAHLFERIEEQLAESAPPDAPER